MDDVQLEERGLSRDCNDSNGSSFATLFCSSSHLFTESNASWKSPSPKAFATASVPPLPMPNEAANPQAWKRRLFFSRMLFNLLAFDSIILLLAALVIWWCVFVVTDFEVYKHFPTMPFGVSIPIIIMAIPLSIFGMTVFIFTTRFCRKLSDLWCRLNRVSVVREPPEERIASLRLQHHSQSIQAHVDDESDIFTAIP
uniref:Transmembrane protein n=1 Tax=Echinococcus granulosus TaxID=6210 RepID=A0A068WSM2_ECHGR|nr:hypothetical protein EgrG_001131200 [Echinococcus granulosus]